MLLFLGQLDAALSMGISFAISAIIKGIDLLVHAQENAIEKGNEATKAIVAACNPTVLSVDLQVALRSHSCQLLHHSD